MLTITSLSTCGSNAAFHCPHCGGALSEWLSLREVLAYLSISNTQRARLERDGFLPQPSLALGRRSQRWRRADLDGALEAGRRISGVLAPRAAQPRFRPVDNSADAAIDAVVRAITGADATVPEVAPQATDWR